MKTGVELIAEERQLHENTKINLSAIPEVLVPKIMSFFEITGDMKLYIKQLTFAGALIAGEIDRLQNSN